MNSDGLGGVNSGGSVFGGSAPVQPQQFQPGYPVTYAKPKIPRKKLIFLIVGGVLAIVGIIMLLYFVFFWRNYQATYQQTLSTNEKWEEFRVSWNKMVKKSSNATDPVVIMVDNEELLAIEGQLGALRESYMAIKNTSGTRDALVMEACNSFASELEKVISDYEYRTKLLGILHGILSQTVWFNEYIEQQNTEDIAEISLALDKLFEPLVTSDYGEMTRKSVTIRDKYKEFLVLLGSAGVLGCYQYMSCSSEDFTETDISRIHSLMNEIYASITSMNTEFGVIMSTPSGINNSLNGLINSIPEKARG